MPDLRISELTAGTVSSTTLFPVAVTTSDTRSVQTNSFPNGTYRVTGLIGANGATSQYSLQADAIDLWRSSDRTRRYISGTSAVLNDIGTTGNNGRDQAGAFSANTWLHFYFVGGNAVTSSSLATRSSLTAPPTGPTLPSSETHWAYAGALRLNASTAIQVTRMLGSWVINDVAEGGVNRVLSAGASTTLVAIDISGQIPPNSRLGYFNFIGSFDNSTEGIRIVIRPTGSTEAGQHVQNLVVNPPVTASAGSIRSLGFYPVSSSQAIDYRVDTTAQRLFLDVFGYQTPNGAE